MAFDITQFRAQFSASGLSSPAHFEVGINLPAALAGVGVTLDGIISTQPPSNIFSSFASTIRSTVSNVISGISGGAPTFDIRFLALTASIPSRNLSLTQYRDNGNPYFMAEGMYNDTPLQMEFIVPRGLNLHDYFAQWQAAAIDPYSFDVGYYSDYVGSVTVTKYDPYGDVEGIFTFNDAYPTTVNQIELSWDAVNQIVKMGVGFTYRTWTGSYVGMSASQRVLNVGSGIEAIAGTI